MVLNRPTTIVVECVDLMCRCIYRQVRVSEGSALTTKGTPFDALHSLKFSFLYILAILNLKWFSVF